MVAGIDMQLWDLEDPQDDSMEDPIVFEAAPAKTSPVRYPYKARSKVSPLKKFRSLSKRAEAEKKLTPEEMRLQSLQEIFHFYSR